MKSYYYSRKINGSFDGTIEKITEVLEKEGFGILTDIEGMAWIYFNGQRQIFFIGFLYHSGNPNKIDLFRECKSTHDGRSG